MPGNRPEKPLQQLLPQTGDEEGIGASFSSMQRLDMSVSAFLYRGDRVSHGHVLGTCWSVTLTFSDLRRP